MTSTDIGTLIAEAVDSRGLRVNTISAVRPLSSPGGLIIIDWSGMASGKGIDGLPSGVRSMVMERHPREVMQVRLDNDGQRSLIATAYAWGAYDVVRTILGPGYAGALPDEWAPIEREARSSGWIDWSWRPMMWGPEIRDKAWHGRDKTLHPVSLGRHDAIPPITIPPPGVVTEHIIQLGVDPQRSSGNRGSRARSGYTPGRGRKATQYVTANQMKTAQFLMWRKRLKKIPHPEAPDAHPDLWFARRVTYAEAQRWIKWLMDYTVE